MPGKSQQKRRKRALRDKKSPVQSAPAPTVQSKTTTVNTRPVAPPVSVRVPTPAEIRQPSNVRRELLRTGVVTGIVIVVLVVLVWVLS